MYLHVQLPFSGAAAQYIYMKVEGKEKKANFQLQRTDLMNQVLLFCYGRIINK